LKSRGYTLIEIIVVMSLIALLAGVGFFQFNNYHRAQKLKSHAQVLVEDLKYTRQLNMSFSGGAHWSTMLRIAPGGGAYEIVNRGTVVKKVKLPEGMTLAVDPNCQRIGFEPTGRVGSIEETTGPQGNLCYVCTPFPGGACSLLLKLDNRQQTVKIEGMKAPELVSP